MNITNIERIGLLGIQAREREVLTQLKPIKDDLAVLFREIEDRNSLNPGSIGTTHQIDIDTCEIQEM